MENETLLVAVFTFVGAFAGSLLASAISLVTAYLDRKERRAEQKAAALNEKQLKKARSLYDQIVTFYRLEKLYIEEIQALRGKGEVSGIQNEFRNRVYGASEANARIELNDSSALAEKDLLFAL